MNIGCRVYYDRMTGNIIQVVGERSGDVVETSIEQDFAAYAALAERIPDTVGHIQLEYGQYAQDFMEGRLARINLETLEPIFSYPNPQQPGEAIVPPKPLSTQVAELEQKLQETDRENKKALFELYTTIMGDES